MAKKTVNHNLYLTELLNAARAGLSRAEFFEIAAKKTHRTKAAVATHFYSLIKQLKKLESTAATRYEKNAHKRALKLINLSAERSSYELGITQTILSLSKKTVNGTKSVTQKG